MKENKILNKLNFKFNRASLALKRKTPEILIVTGILGFGGAIVTACVATTKAGKIVDDAAYSVAEVKEAHELCVTKAGENYTADDYKRDLALVYIQSGIKFAKLYVPTILLTAASTCCILTSHQAMRKRNMALAAACAAIDNSFKEYRGRVIDRFGEQIDKELRYDVKASDTKEISDGNEDTQKRTVNVSPENFDAYKISPYVVVFDSSHPDWNRDHMVNEFFIKARQSQLNNTLRRQGHLFLNEVYDALGFPRTAIGAQAGWIFDEKDPHGDNFVDFRAYEMAKPKPGKEGDAAEYESMWVLDFNACGSIIDFIETHQYI